MTFPVPKPASGTFHHQDPTTSDRQLYVTGGYGYEFRPAVIGHEGNLGHSNDAIMPISSRSTDKARFMIRHTSTFKWPSLVNSNVMLNFSGWTNPAGKWLDFNGHLSNGSGNWRKENWQTAFGSSTGVWINWMDGTDGWKARAQQVVRLKLTVQKLQPGACVVTWWLTASSSGTTCWNTRGQGFLGVGIETIKDIRVRLDTPVGTGHFYNEAW